MLEEFEMLIYYVRETGGGGEGENHPLPVPSALFFILEFPLSLSLTFVFFFCVVLPSPGKIDGPEGFKRIKLYPNTPKTFRFRIDSFSSNVGQ